jgi:hypothetical protein
VPESGPNLKVVEGGELPGKIHDATDLQLQDRKLERSLRKWTQIILLILFCSTNVSTIGLFWFVAIREGTLSNWALGELAGMTTAEVAGLLYVSARYLFPTRIDGSGKGKRPSDS